MSEKLNKIPNQQEAAFAIVDVVLTGAEARAKLVALFKNLNIPDEAKQSILDGLDEAVPRIMAHIAHESGASPDQVLSESKKIATTPLQD